MGLIFHPVRIRIITALWAAEMTTGEIAEAVPGVPLTSLYRHINALERGGLLEIVAENKIRGTVERVYRTKSLASLNPEDLKGMTRDEYEQAFTIFISAFLPDMQQYLDSKEGTELDPIADGVDISKAQIYLSEEEYQDFRSALQGMMLNVLDQGPSEKRRKRVFSYLFIPLD
jgi:DNA-binding transcriptional ArsR family regulator